MNRFIIIIFWFYLCNSSAQYFDAKKHPPIGLQGPIDFGPLQVFPGPPPTFNSAQNKWEMNIDVRNAYFTDFEMSTNKYEFPNYEIDYTNYSKISAYKPYDINRYWEFPSTTSSHKLFVTPSNRESIVFRHKNLTVKDFIKAELDYLLTYAIKIVLEKYYTGKVVKAGTYNTLRLEVENGFFKEFENYGGRTLTAANIAEVINKCLTSEVSKKVIKETFLSVIDAVILDIDPTKTKYKGPDLVNLIYDEMLSKLELNNIIEHAGKLFFKKGIQEILLSSAKKIEASVTLFEMGVGYVDQKTWADFGFVTRIYFKDEAPRFSNLTFNNGTFNWECNDSDNDPLEYDLFIKYPGKSNFEKLNNSSLSQKSFNANKTFLSGSYEWYVTVKYPSNYPLSIKDFYKQIDPSSTKDKINSSTSTFNIGATGSNQGTNSTLPKFTFDSGTYKYIMKVNSLTLTHHTKYNKDYLSNRFSNINNKRTTNFRLFYGPASLTHSGVLNNDVVFLGHEIINNSNTLIGFFYDTKTKKQIDWCYITFLSSNQIKVKFRKDLEDQSGVYSILKN